MIKNEYIKLEDCTLTNSRVVHSNWCGAAMYGRLILKKWKIRMNSDRTKGVVRLEQGKF